MSRISLPFRLFLLLLMWARGVFPQFTGRNYGRSMVIAQQGIVATSHTLASQAGAQMLARGGSAVDAAIAANAVLGVMEPMMDGIGGDLFALYWEAKSGKLTGINASGPAPRGLAPEFLDRLAMKKMPRTGIHSVTVPGAVDGWAKMHRRFGKLPWKDLFQPAISYCERGFPVTEMLREAWAVPEWMKVLQEQPESALLFLPEGNAPAIGDVFRNPDMARALRLLAEKGPDAFYKGDIAAAILKTSQRLGGAMSAADLEAYSAEWVAPISIEYRGWRVYELPPNSQGITALEMLNIMDTRPAAPGDPFSAAEIHQRIEAMKLAYSDLPAYVADPRSIDVPVAHLLSKDYARERASLIDPSKANCSVKAGQPAPGHTTYLSVVDREGNIASWIQSIAGVFGSGVTVDGMGFLLHNRGAGFSLDPKSPNALAGGKRPRHTIIPAFMERGDNHIGFGIQGGPNQPLAHAQFVSNVVDYGMNIQQALESPRFTASGTAGCDVKIEFRVPAPILQQLSERGHQLQIQREYTQAMGRGQAVLHNSKTGVNYGASDPRADGEAVPEPIL